MQVTFLAPLCLVTLLSPPPGDTVSASPATAQDDRITSSSDAMKVEGKILEVMEILPPRLVVDVDGSRYEIELRDGTKAVKDSKTVDLGQLRKGVRIRISGRKPAAAVGRALTADVIEVLPPAR